MCDFRRSTSVPRARHWRFVWLVLGLGAMGAAAACGHSQPIGRCLHPRDTSVIRSDVTKDQCDEVCPPGLVCIWEQGGN